MAKVKRDGTKDEKVEFYREDVMFYALWKYAQPFLESTKEYVDFGKIAPEPSAERVFVYLAANLKKVGLKFHDLHLYTDIEDSDIALPPAPQQLDGHSDQEKEKIISVSQRMYLSRKGNGCTQEDAELLIPLTTDFLYYTYFYTAIPAEEQVKLKPILDEYIRKFLNDGLLVFDRNYLTFESQKQEFFKKIADMNATKKYGFNFVLTEKVKGDNVKKTEFLFIHTLYALQHLGYLTVIRLWHTDNGIYGGYEFHANIALNEKFYEEVSDTYKTANPSVHYEGVDQKEGVLTFAGKQIVISRGGKETHALLLLATLSKDPSRYWYEDEILNDWGGSDEDLKKTPKNRVYHAALKVKNAVARSVQVDDFIEHNTEKFRINPKYLKSL